MPIVVMPAGMPSPLESGSEGMNAVGMEWLTLTCTGMRPLRSDEREGAHQE